MKKTKIVILLQTLLWILLIIFPLGQLTRLPLSLPGINIYVHDLIIALILIIGFENYRKEKNIPPLTKQITAFLTVALFSWLINLSRWGIKDSFLGSLYLLRWFAYSSIYFATHWLARNSKGFKKKTVSLMIISGTVVAVLGLIQYFYYPNFRPMTIFGWDPHLYRIVGTFYDPGFTSMICLLTLIFLIIHYWNQVVKKNFKILFLLLIIYSVLALTYARSGYLAFLVAAATIGLKKKSLKIFLFCTGLLALTILILPRQPGIGTKLERKDTLWARIKSWENGAKIISTSPLSGIGFNNYRLAQKEKGFLENNWLDSHSGAGLDSSLLFVTATTGILGLITYFYFLYAIFKLSFKANSKIKLIVLTTTMSLLAHSLFNNSLFYPWVLIWWWIILGLI